MIAKKSETESSWVVVVVVFVLSQHCARLTGPDNIHRGRARARVAGRAAGTAVGGTAEQNQRLAVSSGSGCVFLQPEARRGRHSTAAGLGEEGKGLQHGHPELCLCSRQQQGTPDPGMLHQSLGQVTSQAAWLEEVSKFEEGRN